jgi:hypothetical protein
MDCVGSNNFKLLMIRGVHSSWFSHSCKHIRLWNFLIWYSRTRMGWPLKLIHNKKGWRNVIIAIDAYIKF